MFVGQSLEEVKLKAKEATGILVQPNKQTCEFKALSLSRARYRRRRRFGLAGGASASPHDGRRQGEALRLIAPRERRRFGHRIHLRLHRVRLHRPLARSLLLTGDHERRSLHRARRRLRHHLPRRHLYGSGSRPRHLHARRRRRREPHPRDQTQGLLSFLCRLL